jgi:hypothetical protein
MSEKDIPDRMDRWNEILEEMIDNTHTLVGDFRETINFVWMYAVFAFVVALDNFALIIYAGNGSLPLIILLSMGMFSGIYGGIWGLNKYIKLRAKYDRLYSLQQEFSLK